MLETVDAFNSYPHSPNPDHAARPACRRLLCGDDTQFPDPSAADVTPSAGDRNEQHLLLHLHGARVGRGLYHGAVGPQQSPLATLTLSASYCPFAPFLWLSRS